MKLKENPFNVKAGDWAYSNSYDYIGKNRFWNKERLITNIPCKNKQIIKERQKREYLSALLEKFAYDNNAVVSDDLWKDNSVYKYYIIYDYCLDVYKVEGIVIEKNINTIYFSNERITQEAINEIVLPFMEGKNEN